MIEHALIIAASAVAFATLVRTFVPSRWNEEVKPFSCDLCMSWWGTVFSAVFLCWLWGSREFELVLPSFAVAYWFLQRLHPVPEGPVALPVVPEEPSQ